MSKKLIILNVQNIQLIINTPNNLTLIMAILELSEIQQWMVRIVSIRFNKKQFSLSIVNVCVYKLSIDEPKPWTKIHEHVNSFKMVSVNETRPLTIHSLRYFYEKR